jgi:hypothetical protein
VKERIIQRLEALRGALSSFKTRLGALWTDPENALLFRGLVFFSFFICFVLLGSGLAVWKFGSAGAPSLAASEKEDIEVSKSVDNDTSSPVIGVRAIPRSISRRQDGVPEPDKDLVEPDIQRGRGLASLIPEQTEPIAPYNPFTTYSEILGSTSEQAQRVGRVALDVSFEVDSYVAMKELQEREKEVKFMIGSLIAEMSYEELRSDEGRLRLKKRIFQEVNYVLKNGKIRDVLYSNFVMR